MTRFLSFPVTCAVALSCTLATKGWAAETPAISPLSSQPTISLSAASTLKMDAATFLQIPVSFTIKDASFLSALDAVLNASGATYSVECRQVKPMRLTFGIKKNSTGNVLDALARAGGCKLYVLPDKLLICPPSLLTKAEEIVAKPFTVLIIASTLPAGKTLPKQTGGTDMLTLANTDVSISINGATPGEAVRSLTFSVVGATCEEHPPLNRLSKDGYIPTAMTLNFDKVPYAEALGVVAQLQGSQLYLLPDRFLICAPGEFLTQAQKENAILALQPNFPTIPTIISSAPNA